LHGEAVRGLRKLLVGLLFGRVFDVLELVDDFLELGKSAKFEIVANVKFLIHEVNEFFWIVLFFKDLHPEKSLFLLFVLVHFFNKFSNQF
jgi:hypothetical protein